MSDQSPTAPAEIAYCGHPLSPPETGYWCRKCGIWIDDEPGEREKYVFPAPAEKQ